MTRLETLKEILKDIKEEERKVIEPLLDDVVFIEERLSELRKLPMIRVHPKNPARQEVTPAGKQYKEYMQSYLNAIKVLQVALNRAGSSEESPLMVALTNFTSKYNKEYR